MKRNVLIYLGIVAWVVVPALAQDRGPKLGPASTQRMRVGLVVKAEQGACRGIVATTPVPFDWPEQSVKIVEEQVSPRVKKVSYRLIDETARQMVIEIPLLAAGEEAQALVTFEIVRHTLTPPEDTSIFVAPKKLDRQLRSYLTESPSIEVRHAKIRALAKEAAAGKPSAWETVEALYDAARAKVQYKFGPLKGGLKALEDGEGDCEDISSLFIALCRVNEIPARTVWVPGHCYPEFYLEDEAGDGHWIPCQAAGDRAFGGIPELRPILQKGDNFRVPEQRQRQRYVAEFFRAADVKGQPSVRFVRETM
jgi:hypothetical protein